jgi:hypothetical protein
MSDKDVKRQLHVWLRAEESTTKASRGAGAVWERDRRTVLTPDGCKSLLDAGFAVTVERSAARIYPDEQYEEAG